MFLFKIIAKHCSPISCLQKLALRAVVSKILFGCAKWSYIVFLLNFVLLFINCIAWSLFLFFLLLGLFSYDDAIGGKSGRSLKIARLSLELILQNNFPASKVDLHANNV